MFNGIEGEAVVGPDGARGGTGVEGRMVGEVGASLGSKGVLAVVGGDCMVVCGRDMCDCVVRGRVAEGGSEGTGAWRFEGRAGPGKPGGLVGGVG